MIQSFIRTGVYAVALEGAKLLLIKQQRGPYREKFDLPGGGIEPGETIEGALRRELREEVGMGFDSMQLLENLSTLTEEAHEDGSPYLFHRIGLIYLINGLFPLPNHSPEMEFIWGEPESFSKTELSPLAWQILPRLSSLVEL